MGVKEKGNRMKQERTLQGKEKRKGMEVEVKKMKMKKKEKVRENEKKESITTSIPFPGK